MVIACLHGTDNAMTVRIRTATTEDAAPACEVLRNSILECCVEDHRNDKAVLSAWLSNKTPETVASWFMWPLNYPIVAVAENRIVGVAILNRGGNILLTYVSPAACFTCAGKALLHQLEATGREWGLRSLQVASTQSAKSFYLRNGYVPIRRTKFPFGVDALALSKRLRAASYPFKPCGNCSLQRE
jgi:hypothetical protein